MAEVHDYFGGNADLAATFQVAAIVGRELLDRELVEAGLTEAEVTGLLAEVTRGVTLVPDQAEMAALGEALAEALEALGDVDPEIAERIDSASRIHEQGRELRSSIPELTALIGMTALALTLLMLVPSIEFRYRSKDGRTQLIKHKGIPKGFKVITDALTGVIAKAAGAAVPSKATKPGDEPQA